MILHIEFVYKFGGITFGASVMFLLMLCLCLLTVDKASCATYYVYKHRPKECYTPAKVHPCQQDGMYQGHSYNRDTNECQPATCSSFPAKRFSSYTECVTTCIFPGGKYLGRKKRSPLAMPEPKEKKSKHKGHHHKGKKGHKGHKHNNHHKEKKHKHKRRMNNHGKHRHKGHHKGKGHKHKKHRKKQKDK